MRITSIEELTALYGEVNPNSLRKEAPSLTSAYRRWIDRSPFMTVATNGAGGTDCSPRGDAVGQLVRITDQHTILFPDRRGNNRLDTLRNLVLDSRISLLFLIPGVQECMRVNGTAIVSTDPDLVRLFDFDGKLPVTVVIVTIGSVYFQCGRAIIRSGLWKTENVASIDEVPTAGEMSRSADPAFDDAAYDAALHERQRGSLY